MVEYNKKLKEDVENLEKEKADVIVTVEDLKMEMMTGKAIPFRSTGVEVKDYFDKTVKPDMKYSGKVKMEYKEWSSKTINYLSSNYEYVKSILETAAKSQEGITGKWMESLEKTNKDYVDVHKWDHKIFVQLGSMTTSTAWLTVDRSKGGLEAWRQLARNNDPKTMQTSMDYR